MTIVQAQQKWIRAASSVDGKIVTVAGLEFLRSPIDPQANRDAWLADRRHRITATDIAAITGLSPWASEADIYMDKLGLSEPRKPTPSMLEGLQLESQVLDQWQDSQRIKIVERGVYALHADKPICAATLDGIAEDGTIVEAKTINPWSPSYRDLGEEGSDEIPDAWLCQVNWQMLVTGAKRASVAVLVRAEDPEDERLLIYYLERDQRFIDNLVHEAYRFVNKHLVPRVPPPLPENGDGLKALSRLHPNRDGEVEWTDRSEEWSMAEYLELSQKIKALRERQEAIRFRLAEKLGDRAEAITPDGYRFVARHVRRAAYTVPESCYTDYRVYAPPKKRN